MKLKMIVAVAGLAFGAAHAAQITTPGTVGGSDLLLNVYEQGAPGGQPDQSFTFDLGMTFNQFITTVAAGPTTTLATLLSSDTTWQSFLSSSDTADAGALQWSVVASGNKVNTRPAIFGSVTAGTDPHLAGTSGFPTNQDLNQSNTQLTTFINNLNTVANPTEQVGLKGSGMYFQDLALANWNGVSFSTNNNIGDSAAVAWINNLSGGTTAAAVVSEATGTLNFSQVNGSYVLTYVNAVPEASGMGMALCGLAALGFLARRRNAA